jgi:hypothetical protein
MRNNMSAMLHRRDVTLVAATLALLAAACSSNSHEAPAVNGSAGSSGASAGAASAPGSGGALAYGGGPVFDFPPGAAGSGTSAPPPMTDVTVVITADNAYGFGYGNGTQIINYFGGTENVTSNDIFACPIGVGPETYTVPAAQANSGAFLYIIGYADKTTTQGVIAKFFREGAEPVYTGAGPWEVCATGIDSDPGSGGPTLDVINQQIALCNAGNLDLATTSGGWVTAAPGPGGNVAFGEDNSTDRNRPAPGNEFKIACDIDPAAQWMWFDWLANRTDGSPFIWPGGDGNPTKDFLIFRLTAESIPEPIPK